ncbi:hypothetical protein AtDm6_0267 [Acetobacter tropicalis]|uniref:Uncharacterized protein n=1 Tax=Acetobacter tropicalis TaxID=104102 RepID=A0A094YWD6_9PROT|nr:hypothetical protein AtDm6_0267 [Acetobacter tropicalis]
MDTRELTGSVLHETVKESSPFEEKAGIKPGPQKRRAKERKTG